MIFKEIRKLDRRFRASCAAVCKEWQDGIGEELFQTLTVRASDLDRLQQKVGRHAHLVRHVTLYFVFSSYFCPVCNARHTGDDTEPRQTISPRPLVQLLSILRSWPSGGELTLEIDARKGPEEDFLTRRLCNRCLSGHKQTAALSWNTWFTLPPQAFLEPEGRVVFHLRNDAPVMAVTTLVISPHAERRFEPKIVKALVQRLPRLKQLSYHFWHTKHLKAKTMQQHCEFVPLCVLVL